MTQQKLETDYLVVGCGASGMAFVDSLISASNADVIMVDHRHAPGGHWLDAYPFVRLHQPSGYYGVNSLPLGQDQVDQYGINKGLYERAGAPEICAYYDRVMRERFLPSGQVRYFPMSDADENQRVTSRLTGATFDVHVRKSVVDARYLEPSIPATSGFPFEVEEGVRCLPAGKLVDIESPGDRFVVIGSGKTGIDVCLWLLECGVPPEDIQWIKPRELMLHNRYYMQCRDQADTLLEGISLQMEAAAQAENADDLIRRLLAAKQFLTVDEGVWPSMYRGATMSAIEVELLRSIKDVVRMGHIRRIEKDRIVLDQGTIPTSPNNVHIHCAAGGLNPSSGVPIFSDNRIVLQAVRIGLTPFNCALIGYIEATRETTKDKNRLCPPNPQPNVPMDWARGMLIGMNAERLWSQEEDVRQWLDNSRLNQSSGLSGKDEEPLVVQSRQRLKENARPGLAKLMALVAADAARSAAKD